MSPILRPRTAENFREVFFFERDQRIGVDIVKVRPAIVTFASIEISMRGFSAMVVHVAGRPVIWALTSHNRRAMLASCDSADDRASLESMKYFPVTPSISGEDAR